MPDQVGRREVQLGHGKVVSFAPYVTDDEIQEFMKRFDLTAADGLPTMTVEKQPTE